MHGISALGDERLVKFVVDRIEGSDAGTISFRDFMEHCLYHPEYGYYMNDSPKIGKQGDFYTSSSIGTLMGEMLAATFTKYWKRYPEPERYVIVEWGGGSGRLAGQILDELKASFPAVYDKVRYHIYDTSGYHRSLQPLSAAGHSEKLRLYSPAEWENESLPDRTVVFSNELLDAFPVHRLRVADNRFYEAHVGWDVKQGRFMEQWLPLAEGNKLIDLIETNMNVTRLSDGQTIELNPEAGEWISRIARKINTGLIVTVDYGEMAEKLYTPSRLSGTLMCYYRHQAHDDPYVNVGRQDMTAHVNFSTCVKAGIEAGFTEWSFETQKQFLLEAGILERLQNHAETDPFHPIAKRNRAIRQLLVGDRMGDLFKVLTQKKGD